MALHGLLHRNGEFQRVKNGPVLYSIVNHLSTDAAESDCAIKRFGDLAASWSVPQLWRQTMNDSDVPRSESFSRRVPWNKGKLPGAKPPLMAKPRVVHQDQASTRSPHADLALFNLAVDTKEDRPPSAGDATRANCVCECC